MYSELDDDFDTCEPCQKCGQEVHEAGAPLCDDCDPEKQYPDIDCDPDIPF